MFELTKNEFEILRSQFASSSWGGLRYAPMAFTEHGVLMIFYKLIVGTPAEDTPDFIGWAMCYRSYFRTLQSKFSIEEISTGVA